MAVERPKVKFSEHGELIVTTAVLCQILDLGPEMISRHNRAGMPKWPPVGGTFVKYLFG